MLRRHSLLTVVLILVGSALLLAIVSIAVLLDTDWGRARVCKLVNEAVTKGIAGELKVGRIVSLSYGRVIAHDVVILAPDGEPAIKAERAEIEFEPSVLWSQTPGWSRAVIDRCHVRVTEGPDGKVNMEKTFAKRGPKPKPEEASAEKKEETGLDLRTMVTSNCELLISGGTMPTLRMVDLAGIMRVHVLPNGDTELRFDDYRGKFTEGLPTGLLDFRNVKGEVRTAQKRLLFFEGQGKSEGEEVAFRLDIGTKPTKVKIDATFREVTVASMRARVTGLWAKFSPSLELNVRQQD